MHALYLRFRDEQKNEMLYFCLLLGAKEEFSSIASDNQVMIFYEGLNPPIVDLLSDRDPIHSNGIEVRALISSPIS